ncbi:hypothetical protein GCM10018955_41790 [Planomonospora venezuelensis]
MVSRAIAVVSACLLAAGTAPPGAGTAPDGPPGTSAAPADAVAPVTVVAPARFPAAVPERAALPVRAAAPPGAAVSAAGPAGCPVAARAASPGRGPEPRAPGPEQVAEMIAALDARRPVLRRAAWTPVTVPTWVHVITDGAQGAPDGAVQRQLAVLNDAYGGRFGGADTGIRFRLDGLTRTENPAWFRDPITHEREMKRLRRGGSGTLNLYVAQLGRLVLGYSTYPHWYAAEPRLDGVVVDWRSLPRRVAARLRPRLHRGPRDRPLAGAAAHLRERLPGSRGRGRRHAAGGPPHHGLPGGQGHLPGRRPGPGPQLHGLLPRRLHVRVHQRAGGPDAGLVGRVPAGRRGHYP